jgi:hypothetical protein
MLRVSEIRLPIDHRPEALPAAVAARLGVAVPEIGEAQAFSGAAATRARRVRWFSVTAST